MIPDWRSDLKIGMNPESGTEDLTEKGSGTLGLWRPQSLHDNCID